MAALLAQGVRLRSLRKSRGLTQQTVCEALGLTLRDLFLFEKGKKNPSVEVWKKLSAYYDIPLETLMASNQIESLGDYLLHLRQERRLIQSDVATAIGISKRTLIAYEQGMRPPKMETLARFAELYQVPMEDFVKFNTSEEKSSSGSQQVYQFLKQWEQRQSQPLTAQEAEALIYQLSRHLTQLRESTEQESVSLCG